ncbi:hypothetical protein BH10CYA1_BH10CYA1_17980 [soil metagenome]
MSDSPETSKISLSRIIGFIGQIVVAVRQLQLSRFVGPFARFCAWGIFFGAVALYGFLSYTAFGGGADVGALAGGLLGAGLLAYFVKNLKSIKSEWPWIFKGLAFVAMSASAFLTATGALHITQPQRDWSLAVNFPLFGLHLVVVFLVVFVALPLFLHVTSKLEHVTHLRLHASFGLGSFLLGVAAVIGMSCFAWYFTLKGEGGSLPATIDDVFPIFLATVSLFGICVYAKNWYRIFRGELSFDSVAIRAFTIGALFVALWIMNRGVWNSLYPVSILSPQLPLSAKLTFASIAVMFDSMILFGAPLVNGARERLIVSIENPDRPGVVGMIGQLGSKLTGKAPMNSPADVSGDELNEDEQDNVAPE